jgi:HSP20 family protein
VAGSRDPFANFERMRREMDALFGGVMERRVGAQRPGGFSPAVDVYYTADPPRAVVRADLAGIDPSEVALELRGRDLILSGRRRLEAGEERAYQQLEIDQGPFRRVISLGVEVDRDAARASYDDGMLLVELPIVRKPVRTVPVRAGRPDGAR